MDDVRVIVYRTLCSVWFQLLFLCFHGSLRCAMYLYIMESWLFFYSESESPPVLCVCDVLAVGRYSSCQNMSEERDG